MKMTAFIRLVTEQYIASDAEVLPGRSAGGSFRAGKACVGEGSAHTVVFEAARRIHPFVLQIQLAWIHADVLADFVGLLEQRLAFADGNHFVGWNELNQFMETPHAAKAERIMALSPHVFEIG